MAKSVGTKIAKKIFYRQAWAKWSAVPETTQKKVSWFVRSLKGFFARGRVLRGEGTLAKKYVAALACPTAPSPLGLGPWEATTGGWVCSSRIFGCRDLCRTVRCSTP